MITTEQFELKLIEYLDGELSDAEKREVEEYLQAHPEAIELKGDFSRLCAAGKSIRESNFPADLLLEANRKLAARLADSRQEHVASTPIASNNGSPETTPSRTWLPNWRRRFPAARTGCRTRRAGNPLRRCHAKGSSRRHCQQPAANRGDPQRRAPVR